MQGTSDELQVTPTAGGHLEVVKQSAAEGSSQSATEGSRAKEHGQPLSLRGSFVDSLAEDRTHSLSLFTPPQPEDNHGQGRHVSSYVEVPGKR